MTKRQREQIERYADRLDQIESDLYVIPEKDLLRDAVVKLRELLNRQDGEQCPSA